MDMPDQDRTVPADLYITEELARRPEKTPDYLREKQALQDLATHMVEDPKAVLPRLVDLAMELTGGSSSGLSLYESNPAPGVFRWRYLRGILAPFDGATTPRNFSPCGITLDQKCPVLSKHPEQFYNWISDANIIVPEVLLVPLYLGKAEPLGTLWIVANSENHFDKGDARIAAELAAFAGIALRMLESERELQSSLSEQETLTKEMAHRVKNLFAIADGMVRLSARSAESVKDMELILAGRFHALASAHSLVRRSFSPAGEAAKVTDISGLLKTLLEPHEISGVGGRSRFSLHGPQVSCGEHAINGIALIFHELATNAVKYGALNMDSGVVDIGWTLGSEHLMFVWTERGGPKITSEPTVEGFGTKLLRDTIYRQFRGELECRWDPEGLEATIRLPVSSLHN
jgi:two-component sensor histidine kinase